MTGRAQVMSLVPRLSGLAADQEMVLTRSQLKGMGITHWAVDDHVKALRWREICPGVLVLHRGPITAQALRWVAVLGGGECAALGAWTALTVRGLSGWERDGVHIVVPRGRHVPSLAGVIVHESRRHTLEDVRHLNGLPIHSVERAAVDAACWSPNPRTACGLLAATVQQGLSRPDRLLIALDAVGRVAHRRAMAAALLDVQGGAMALSEIDLARLCRSSGLPEPTRQRIRRDVSGRRRYLDAEWELADGTLIQLEIDGVGHMDAGQWYDDLLRQAEIVVPARHVVIRLPAAAARLEPERVVAILRRAMRLAS